MTYDIFWHLARLPRTRTGIQGKKAQRWLDLMSWRDLETRLANGWIDWTEVLSICLCILRFGFVGLCGSHCKASVGRQTAEAKRWAHIEFEASKRLKSLSDLDVEFKWVMQMNANVNVFQDSKMFQVFQNFKTQFTVALPLMEFEIEVKVSSQKPNPVGWHFALHSIEELQSSRQGQRHRLRTSVRFRLHSLDILRVPQLQICRPAAWKDSGDCAETRYRGRCAFAMIYDSDRLIGHIRCLFCIMYRFSFQNHAKIFYSFDTAGQRFSCTATWAWQASAVWNSTAANILHSNHSYESLSIPRSMASWGFSWPEIVGHWGRSVARNERAGRHQARGWSVQFWGWTFEHFAHVQIRVVQLVQMSSEKKRRNVSACPSETYFLQRNDGVFVHASLPSFVRLRFLLRMQSSHLICSNFIVLSFSPGWILRPALGYCANTQEKQTKTPEEHTRKNVNTKHQNITTTTKSTSTRIAQLKHQSMYFP